MVKVARPVVSLSPHLGGLYLAKPRAPVQTAARTVHIPPQWYSMCMCVCGRHHSIYKVCVPKSRILRMRHAILRCDQDADDGCLHEQALRFTQLLTSRLLRLAYSLTLMNALTQTRSTADIVLTYSRRTLLALYRLRLCLLRLYSL